jgi:c-di-GMP-binding flagellar brake protein YcgR
MTDTNRPKDRRLHPRVPVQGHVALGEGAEGRAVLTDISMSGVACLSGKSFEEMTVLEMIMELPFGDETRAFKAGGAVVRSKAREDGGYLVAIFFTHMDDAARTTLSEYITTIDG